MPQNLNKNYLTDLMDLLSPRGTSKSIKSGTPLDNIPIEDQVRNFILDKPKNFKSLQELVNNYYTQGPEFTNVFSAGDVEITGLAKVFHAVSRKRNLVCAKKGFEDQLYWLQGASREQAAPNSVFDIVFGPKTFKDVSCEVAVIVTNDPYISPAAASTEDIEIFLNYIPSIVQRQMSPYLEVEFASNKAHNKDKSFNHLSTPSLLRFLLGSVPWRDADNNWVSSFTPTAADQSLVVVREGETTRGNATADVISGMEVYLAPQSLTNMDNFKSSKFRLMDAKPFVPFASIINFEVSTVNAGAGDMAHKTAKLTLVLHDRSRMSEMADFFRGPVGYGNMKVWTSYGWLAPRRPDGELDEYARFINENMHSEDCWQIRNTNFTFDQSGKVNVVLDLVGHSVSQTRRTSIKIASDAEKYLNGFALILDEIQEAAKEIQKLPLGPDARVVQILNAGAVGSMLPADIKPEQFPDLLNSVKIYAQSAGIDEESATKLISQLEKVLDPKKYKAGIAIERQNSIKNTLMEVSKTGTDPFLARTREGDVVAINSSFFSDKLVSEVDYFYQVPAAAAPPTPTSGGPGDKTPATATSPSTASAPSVQNNSDEKEIPREIPGFDGTSKVMSFGKLFCQLVLPAVLEANSTTLKNRKGSELQVIFYTLNDECGPVSGQSVAEFPIDMERLSYAIDSTLSAKNRVDLTIEDFLRVCINSQFADDRAIGYGKLSKNLFAPFDKTKPGAAKNENATDYESKLSQWQSQNPVFSRPVIEMFIETSKPDRNTASRIHELLNTDRAAEASDTITRIHVYDKQNNPRKLLSKVINVGGKLFVGAFNDTDLRRRLKNQSLTKEDLAQLIRDAQEASKEENPKVRAQIEADLRTSAGISIKTPDGSPTGIPIEAKLFGDNGIRAQLRKLAPTLQIGTEGTQIKTVQLQSKTDDLMAAANLINIMKGKPGGSANNTDPPANGLEAPGGLPIRTVPAQLTITTVGVPNARLYQQYFVDLGTGTSLDNLYNCTQLRHTLTPGKFETSMTFAYTDGYGKYTAPPAIAAILSNAGKQLQNAQQKATEGTNDQEKPKATSAASTPAQSAGATPVSPETPPVRPPGVEPAKLKDPPPGLYPGA